MKKERRQAIRKRGRTYVFNRIYGGTVGIDGFLVTVETNAQNKIPRYDLVGLPDLAVKEAKERVRAACENSGFLFPAAELTQNLAPADRRKEGSSFDAAILMGILYCTGVLRSDLDLSKKCIIGELSLTGSIRAVRGVLCMCAAARDAGHDGVLCAPQKREGSGGD